MYNPNFMISRVGKVCRIYEGAWHGAVKKKSIIHLTNIFLYIQSYIED